MRIQMITAAIAAATLVVPATAAAEGFDGFYVGGEIGSSRTEGKFENETPQQVRARQEQQSSGAAYGVFGGWGTTLGERFYLGGEFGIGGGGEEVSRQLSGATVRLDPQGRYTLTGRAGVLLFERGMLFARAGYEARQYEVTFRSGRKSEEGFSGSVFGVGYEHLFGEKLSLRGEVIGVQFSDSTLQNANRTERLKVEPNDVRAMVGVSYRF